MFNINAIAEELAKLAEPVVSRLDRIIELLESIDRNTAP